MTLSDLDARVSQRLNEGASGPVFYPQAELTASINEGYRFFCLLTLGLEVTKPWTVPPGITLFRMMQIAQFTDWIVPLRITTTTGMKIRPARFADLSNLDTSWLNAPGVPQRYCGVGADLVVIYKQPTVATVLNVTYAYAPAPLVNPGDIPLIPEEYHPRLVDYGIYRNRQVEGAQELEKALKFLDSFLDGAAHYAAYVRARNQASRYDKVPFEIEKFDRSSLLKLRKDLVPERKPADS